MTSPDGLEGRLYYFLEDLGRGLPARGDESASYELRVFSALTRALQKDLRWLWEGPEIPGRPKRSGDDDEYDWRKAAASDAKNNNTFVRSVAWLDVFFWEHDEFMVSNLSPLSQLRARVSMALQELHISRELWERIRKEKEDLALKVRPAVWAVILEEYDREKY